MQSKRNNTPSNIENEEITHRPKTVHFASNSWSQTEIYTDIKKVNEFYETNNENFVGIQRKLKNMIEYRSDLFRNNWKVSKHSLSLTTF